MAVPAYLADLWCCCCWCCRCVHRPDLNVFSRRVLVGDSLVVFLVGLILGIVLCNVGVV
jgi:hypothetical protein